ncbi:beta-2-glycoprotein 1-like isoform X1 [Pleurodeles waltl]|uniref:beta-2-glycoprotein 1-like isoform X1 n=1 Tax=Pleurodeles waltl TaxID=8319 RepID=UPI0037098D66
MSRCINLFLHLSAILLTISLMNGQEVPETCPPRREDLTAGRGQTCLRSCLQDRDCSGKRRCMCDGDCGMSCVLPARSCPWPLTLENADTSLVTQSKFFGAQMKVDCHSGFKMADGEDAALIRCQGDRKWSQAMPCEEDLNASASCDPPERIESGFYNGFSFRVGSSVQYFCKEGYALEGSAVRTCQENLTWSPAAPACRQLFCPPPDEITNGYLVAVEKLQYRVYEVIYYLCKRNFFLDGPNKVSCQANGQWSALPACRDRCKITAQRSRVLYKGKKLWITEIPEGLVHHLETVTFFCRNQTSSCSYKVPSRCFDGKLPLPACYDEPTVLQYHFFPKKVVSEIAAC